MDIQSGPIGSVGHESVKFEGLNLILEGDAAVAFGSLGVVAKLDARVALRAIAKKIPGVWDDAAIEFAIVELEKLG